MFPNRVGGEGGWAGPCCAVAPSVPLSTAWPYSWASKGPGLIVSQSLPLTWLTLLLSEPQFLSTGDFREYGRFSGFRWRLAPGKLSMWGVAAPAHVPLTGSRLRAVWVLLLVPALVPPTGPGLSEPPSVAALSSVSCPALMGLPPQFCLELYNPSCRGQKIKACKTDGDGKVVEGKHESYRISAPSAEERDQWIEAIR